MQEYHKIWLEKHPERDEEWLKERLKEGFDIHHADGDHSNNDPANLVLIEHVDHMGIHGANINRMLNNKKMGGPTLEERLALGKKFYEDRSKPMSWAQVYEKHFGKIEYRHFNYQSKVTPLAKKYAEHFGLPWPIDVGDFRAEQTIRPERPFCY